MSLAHSPRRARRLLAAAPVLFAAGLCGSSPAQTGPPPIPPVQSVTAMGTVTQNPLIQARDGTASALLEGRSVWVFGDTAMTKANATGNNFIDNSLSWATDLNAANGITLNGDYLDSTGVPTEFMPYLPWEAAYNAAHDSKHCTASPCGAEFAMWPGPLVPDPARQRVLIFYTEIWRVAGQSSWTTIGTGIALWQNGKITRPIVNPGARFSTLIWTGTQTGYSGGWVVSGDTLYAYGCSAGFLVQNCALGKVALANATVPDGWSYYTATGTWSANPADAVTLFQGGAAGNSVFYNNYLGVYMVIYSAVFSNDVYFRVAYTPWGPWSDQTLIFTGLPGYQGSADYAALAHPEFAQGNGQIQYITYVQNTGFLAQSLQLVQVAW
jgi:Domain of unknown function (DUF4185)